MKKVLVVLAVLSFSSFAFANQMNTGCGLGTMLLGKSANTTIMQWLVTTTNQSFSQGTMIALGVQSFGCTQPKSFVMNDTYVEFVAANMDSIVRDVAMGSGETITTLANIMEVADSEAFGKNLQANFNVIFPSADVEYAHVADAIVLVSQI